MLGWEPASLLRTSSSNSSQSNLSRVFKPVSRRIRSSWMPFNLDAGTAPLLPCPRPNLGSNGNREPGIEWESDRTYAHIHPVTQRGTHTQGRNRITDGDGVHDTHSHTYIVDGDDLHLRMVEGCSQHQPPDTAEPVDSNLHRHLRCRTKTR
jgi:hypothetical protein